MGRLIDADALREELERKAQDYYDYSRSVINDRLVRYLKGKRRALLEISDYVRDQPTVEAAPKWIPCSERMPEEPEENPVFENKRLELYLVSCKGADYPFRAFWTGKVFTDGWSKLKNVTAWMPLPGPYKEIEK